MRALGNPRSSEKILDGHRIYYNFIRPHMALDGRTPAEEAGLDLNLGDNKWKGLIDKAVKNDNQELKKVMNKEMLDYFSSNSLNESSDGFFSRTDLCLTKDT